MPSFQGLAIATKRTPLWRSSIQSTLSGKETAISYMSYPLYQWSIDIAVLRSYGEFTELAQMVGFVNTCQGMAGRFLYQDAEDNLLANQLIGTGDGSKVSFQIVRSYGGYIEPVQFPGAVTVYVNGVAATNATVGALGVVTFAQAPAAGSSITVSGPFYFLCRMLQDNPEFDQEHVRMWSLSGLKFQSVKL